MAAYMAVAAIVFPWACHQHRPVVTVVWATVPAGKAGWADVDLCRIRLDRGEWRLMSRGERCTLLTHEVGHLAGMVHSPDRRNVMWPTVDRVHRLCRRFDRPYRTTTRPRG